MNLNKRKKLIKNAIIAALKAGKEIVQIYYNDDFNIQLKSDNSPLTIADQKAHNTIVRKLKPFKIPILSEEGNHLSFNERKKWEYCWIVDPLDGTKEFIKRNNEFTVNIALIRNNEPICGIIYVPIYQQLYFSDIELGAFRVDEFTKCEKTLDELIKKSQSLPDNENGRKYTVVGSRSHMNIETKTFIKTLKQKKDEIDFISKGSSIKLCMIAEGRADIYPRCSTTMEWDTAAGHALIKAAGYKLTQIKKNKTLTYNKKQLNNPWFVATSE